MDSSIVRFYSAVSHQGCLLEPGKSEKRHYIGFGLVRPCPSVAVIARTRCVEANRINGPHVGAGGQA